mmetsp:Transcript_17156/g.20793  ORF Transcript_17156/g.20793 Transcript_17156/m.20793 type:complete len:292 (-) Transcript_17156:694-1569(-)
MQIPPLIESFKSKGYYAIIGNGTKSCRIFIREEGSKDAFPIVLVHGVPSSSFMYRGMLEPLAAAGFRAITFDFPGMGLSEKPSNRDYSWSSQKRSMLELMDVLELDEMHLVIHDIGGPIASMFAAENKERVKSITILNTLLKVNNFQKPFPMWTFTIPYLNNLFIAMATPLTMHLGIKQKGVHDSSVFTYDVATAWHYMLKNNNGQESFLKIMNGFETDEETEELIRGIKGIPCHVVWGKYESSLKAEQLEYVKEEFDPVSVDMVPGAHFIQEDNAEVISSHIITFLERSV